MSDRFPFGEFALWRRFISNNGRHYVKITEGAAVNIETGIIDTFLPDDICEIIEGVWFMEKTYEWKPELCILL